MADKYTPLIVAALAKSAANPAGTALYGSKAVATLFPNTLAGRTAASRALSDGYLTVSRAEPNGKEAYTATEKGLRYLLDQSNPKVVLEDLVRGLENRQAKVDELLEAAHGMASELKVLKATVAAVLPAVVQTRLNTEAMNPSNTFGRATCPRKSDTLPATLLARLADWASTAGSGQDCPLPDLYRSLTVCDDLSVGRFHDGLRSLHAAKKIYLHPWTGPLYALPEPAFALLIGHEVSYYASPSGQWPVVGGPKSLVTSGH